MEGTKTRAWRQKNNCCLEDPKEEDPLDDIENYPPFKYFGDIKYCTTLTECTIAVDSILKVIDENEEFPLGFDMEWPFNYVTGPEKTALIQLCADKRVCYLLHVSKIEKLPLSLISLLTHPKVIICGVNIRNDIHKLGRDFPDVPTDIILEKCVDSRNQAKQLSSLTNWGMEKLINHFLKMKIDKESKVRKSKWNIIPLSDEQKYYAATDAYASLVLYLVLSSYEKNKNTCL